MGLKIFKNMLFVIIGILLAMRLSAGERVDWLLSQGPRLALKSEKGGLEKFRITDFKLAGKSKNRIGSGQVYNAVIEKSREGVCLWVEELENHSAIIIHIELKDGLKDSEMGFWENMPMGIELDLPEDYPEALSFKMSPFAPPRDKIVPSAGPVLLYNHSFETILISPLDHFLVSLIKQEGTKLQIGLEGDLKTIPENFSHPIIIYFGKGIRDSFEGWGELVRAWHNKERPGAYADVGLSYLGYWTDNGAYYYYKTEEGLNYEQTLLKVKEEADRLSVPFGYFQVDSWWYVKSTDKGTGFGAFSWIKNLLGGGAIRWSAKEDVFPDGLGAFQKNLALPLIAHNRWYDKKTDYKKEYEFVDGVGSRKPSFPIEERFWEMIMDNAKNWGIQVYEQDWLDTQWDIIPYLRQSIGAGENWLSWMSQSAKSRGLSIQYCMANPGMFMQAVKYSNVTQVRVSGDYLAGAPKEFHWLPFFKVSMLAWACGLYPWKDTYLSSSGQRAVRDESRGEEETLISILSAGLVGPGDRIGYINKELLLRTCRKDGLLLKPDKPAMPIDKMFGKHNTLYTVITETRTELGTYYYVAGFNMLKTPYLKKEIGFDDLGIEPGEYLVYDWKEKKIQGENGKIVYPEKLKTYEGAYYVLVPKLDNLPALAGEKEKFITVSKARFKQLKTSGSKLMLELACVKAELIELGLASEQKPLGKIISGGEIIEQSYDPETRIFRLKFRADAQEVKLEIE